jgi:hypothetical protein
MNEAAEARFGVVVDHDRGECAFEENEITIEEHARSAIEAEKQKGRDITISVFEAVDIDAARQRAKARMKTIKMYQLKLSWGLTALSRLTSAASIGDIDMFNELKLRGVVM